MPRIGLKLWSTNVDSYYREAIRLYGDGMFDYIELYVLPGSMNLIDRWKRLRIPFVLHNAHAMNGFNLAKRENLEGNMRIYSETKAFADELDAKYIIFHGGIDGSIDETARQMALIGDSRSLLENKPCKAIPNELGLAGCRGFDAREIKKVMDVSGCGFCLDFGHAICAAATLGIDPYEHISSLAALSPRMFHLTDNDDMRNEYDTHAHLGKGAVDIKRILAVMPADAMITIETDKDSQSSLDDFAEDVRFLRRLA